MIFYAGFGIGYAVRGVPFAYALVPVWVAMLVCAAGIAWRVWGASCLGGGIVFDSAIVTDELYVGGPYRYTRNPLYFGLSLYALGIALIGHWLTVVVVFFGIGALQQALIVSEERRLTARFGERYLAYVRAVPQLVPSLRPRVPDAGSKPSLGVGLGAEVYVIALALISFGYALSHGR